MKNNIVSVLLWGKEFCKLQWQGGYIQGFGKVGTKISFSKDYKDFVFDVDPLGPCRKSFYWVQRGMSDICHATEYEGLPRFLSCSLPDDWGNQVFSSWKTRNGILSHDITALDKLSFIGKRGMGAFEFIPELYSPQSDDAIQLDELYHLAREIENARKRVMLNYNDNPAINDLIKVGVSAGGMHPKAVIAINWKTGEIRSGQVDCPADFVHCLLKFRDSDFWPTAEIEYSYYQMALDCGIEMEKSSLLEASSLRHFITERFDRKDGKKVHSATLKSLCGEIHSYEEIFMVCRKLQLTYHEIEQLYRRIVFNYLSCVCDDHDKNFSFLMTEDGKWHLSPAYDVTFTANLQNRFVGDKHYMSLGGQNRWISYQQFLDLAHANDIKNPELIIEEIKDTVARFPSYASLNNIDSEIVSMILTQIERQMECCK